MYQSLSSNGIATAISPTPSSLTGSNHHHHHHLLHHTNLQQQQHDGLFNSNTITMPSTSTLLSNSVTSQHHHHHHLLSSGGGGGSAPNNNNNNIIGSLIGGNGSVGTIGSISGLGSSIGSSIIGSGGSGASSLDRTLSCRGSASLLTDSSLLSDNDFPLLAARGGGGGGPFALPTTSSYHPLAMQPLPPSLSQPSSINTHLYSKDAMINALQQRAPYGYEPGFAANLIRSGDNSSMNQSTVEFHIQNEDFPALPGASAPGSTTIIDNGGGTGCNILLSQQMQPQQQQQQQLILGSGTTADGGVSDARFPERLKMGVIQTHQDGRVTGIPAEMLNDQFGMAGLLTCLRAIENDPKIVALALGHDLTTLGLNLNAPDKNLFATFGGPWADFACRTQDLDTKVPEEYLTNATIREKLPNIKLNRLADDVLFYLFYNCPGEIYQMAAAYELYSRDWRFHKGECVWLTRSQFGAPKEQTGQYEKGMYNVFDPTQWRKIPKEMTLEYTQLEERPKMCL